MTSEPGESPAAGSRAESEVSELARFASTVSHDLRTPLAAVVGYLELLRLRLGDDLDPVAGEYLSRAEKGAAQVDLMLNALQHLARVPASPPRQRVGWREIVDGAMGVLDDELLVSVDGLTIADPLPEVTGDPDTLQRAVVALLDNALRHHPRPDEARVVVRVNEAGALVVEDDGDGVADADLTRVVELFRTGRSPRAGTGLGLALAARIARVHGGSLVLSRSPMGGLRATLRLGG